MKNVELMGSLKVAEDDGTITIINEGDYVTCYIGDDVHYIGKLARIGYWQAYDGMDSSSVAILIECKEPKTVYSSNIILLSDIKCIHKMTEKELQKVEKVISKISQTKFTGNKKTLKNYEK